MAGARARKGEDEDVKTTSVEGDGREYGMKENRHKKKKR